MSRKSTDAFSIFSYCKVRRRLMWGGLLLVAFLLTRGSVEHTAALNLQYIGLLAAMDGEGANLETIIASFENLSSQDEHQSTLIAARASYALGFAHQMRGEDDEAIAAWEKAKELGLDPVTLLILQGDAYERMGEAKAALSRYEVAFEIDPSIGGGLSDRRKYLFYLTHLLEAEQCLLFEMTPCFSEHITLLNNAGFDDLLILSLAQRACLTEKICSDRLDDGQSVLEKVKLPPYREADHLVVAVSAEMIKLGLWKSNHLALIIHQLLEVNSLAAAEDALAHGLRLLPREPAVLFAASQLHLAQGDLERSLQMLRQAREVGESSNSLYELARHLLLRYRAQNKLDDEILAEFFHEPSLLRIQDAQNLLSFLLWRQDEEHAQLFSRFISFDHDKQASRSEKSDISNMNESTANCTTRASTSNDSAAPLTEPTGSAKLPPSSGIELGPNLLANPGFEAGIEQPAGWSWSSWAGRGIWADADYTGGLDSSQAFRGCSSEGSAPFASIRIHGLWANEPIEREASRAGYGSEIITLKPKTKYTFLLHYRALSTTQFVTVEFLEGSSSSRYDRLWFFPVNDTHWHPVAHEIENKSDQPVTIHILIRLWGSGVFWMDDVGLYQKK